MRIRVAHASLQFRDTDRQHTHDIEKIFDRARRRRLAWITGTESGPGAGNTGRELVRVAKENGYRPWVPEVQSGGIAAHTDCWIAVRKDLIGNDWEMGYRHVIPGSKQLADVIDLPKGKRWGPKGLVHVSFESSHEGLGRVAIGAAHYLTDARRPGSPYWVWNKKLAEETGRWAREEGRGPAIVFYGGDQNMADNRNNEPQGDTFFGEPLTSTWDELKKWENTGHGVIDVIATYNKDRRVSALRTNALNDREFFLHGDHFFVEADLNVAPVRR